jgi:hypothetical protein
MTQTRGADRTRLLSTSANIRTELGLMLKNMDEADRVVIALAGHGVQLSGARRATSARPMRGWMTPRS